MNRIWKVIFTILIILVMGIALLSSVDNGSPAGNFVKRTGIVQDVQRKYKSIMKEAMEIKVAPMP